MKRIASLFLLVTFLAGCATYRFQHGSKPYDKGYVASRDDNTILEYTLGKDNTVPDNLALARERFKRRRKIVEHYYKKMDYIDNHFKMIFWNPCIYTLKTMKGIFRLPFIAISDYRYAHNPKYRERMGKTEAQIDAQEEKHLQQLKDKLNLYIQKDIAREAKEPTAEELAPTKTEQTVVSVPERPKAWVEKKAEISQAATVTLPGEPVAIIVAKPARGFSPLKVRFNGRKSYAAGRGKIVSYLWDFGDTESSQKANPANTYYSGTFAPQYFNVTLTVQDDKGRSAKATAKIEVLNK